MKRNPDILCCQCGKSFHTKRKGAQFCSRECSAAYRKAHGLYKMTEETKQKLSKARTGKPAWNKGVKMTEEQRLNMITAVKAAWTPEKRLTQQKKQKEVWSNPELLQKHSEIMKSLMTEEHKKVISDATKQAMSKPGILEKIKESCLAKYGVEWNCLRPEANNHITISKKNRYWQQLLNIPETDLEFALDGFSFDMKIGDTLIEINPSETHNSTYGLFGGQPKDHCYHIRKTCTANKHNFNCVHVWDWDNEDKIKNMFKDKKMIGGRLCTVKEIEDKKVIKNFLNTYHFQNSCKGTLVAIGLFFNDLLIGLMTFGKPRYNRNFQWELLRLCYHSDYTVQGGTQKMFKYFLSNYKPTSIISYCDKSKFSGETYLKLGFTLLDYNQPSKHWYNIKTYQHITDNLLRQQGADRLLGTNGGKGSSNEEIMLQNGFVEVYDCGQSTYIWKEVNE